MYHSVVTVFNFHEKTSMWYPTVFKGTHLIEAVAETATRDSGRTNSDAVELIIPVQQDRSVNTIIYDPYLVVDNEGNHLVGEDQKKLSYKDPETKATSTYIGPKGYANLEDPDGYFTFKPETDFMVVGNYASGAPVDDDDYDEGFYHAMNDAQDGVYMITSAVFYGLLPHFEIGGR